MVARTERRVSSDLAIPPGELLAEELEIRGMSQKELAERTGRPEQTISEIINGKKIITPDTALELGRVLGIPADFWVNSEASYQLTRARLREQAELDEQLDWLKDCPVRDLRNRGLLPRTRDRREVAAALLEFFQVASFSALRQHQEAALQYRITPGSKVSECALWAWLRLGTLEAERLSTADYNESRFRAALTEIRSLTTERDPQVFIPKIQEFCASAGVAFVVVRHFPRTGANGVARWLSPRKAMIQLSTHRKHADIFWFTFFHEAKHVLEQRRKRVFVNSINDEPGEEGAADQFARDFLIPKKEWRPFAATEPRSFAAVRSFAARIGIQPGIVVGRLQKEGIIPYTNLNQLRLRFEWKDSPGD